MVCRHSSFVVCIALICVLTGENEFSHPLNGVNENLLFDETVTGNSQEVADAFNQPNLADHGDYTAVISYSLTLP